MLKELDASAHSPESVKQVAQALSILIDRIGSLPLADRDDLFELLKAWHVATTREEQGSIRRAMEEILVQLPIGVKALPLGEGRPMSRGLASWAQYVGGTIRELREQKGLTQAQLAAKADLPQSHISRLENAVHSATHLTLEKIARALGVEIGALDPGLDGNRR